MAGIPPWCHTPGQASTGLAQGLAWTEHCTPTGSASGVYCGKKRVQKMGEVTEKERGRVRFIQQEWCKVKGERLLHYLAAAKHNHTCENTELFSLGYSCLLLFCTLHTHMYLTFLSRKVVCTECWTAQSGSSTESGTSRARQGMVAWRHTWKLPSLDSNSMLSSYSHWQRTWNRRSRSCHILNKYMNNNLSYFF